MKTATAKQAGRSLWRGWSGICFTVLVAAALALAGTATGQGNGKRNGNGKAEEPYPVSVSATPLPLNLEDPAQTSVGQLTYRGGFVLTANDPNFGGFSGLLVDPDGRGLLAITDRGYWFSADLVQGELQGLKDAGPEKVEVAVIPPEVTDTLAELAARAESLADTVEEKVG